MRRFSNRRGLAMVTIPIFPVLCSRKCVLHCTTWHQPYISRGFIDKYQKLATQKKQNTAALIELISQQQQQNNNHKTNHKQLRYKKVHVKPTERRQSRKFSKMFV